MQSSCMHFTCITCLLQWPRVRFVLVRFLLRTGCLFIFSIPDFLWQTGFQDPLRFVSSALVATCRLGMRRRWLGCSFAPSQVAMWAGSFCSTLSSSLVVLSSYGAEERSWRVLVHGGEPWKRLPTKAWSRRWRPSRWRRAWSGSWSSRRR